MGVPTAPTVSSIVLDALTRFYNSQAPTDPTEIALATTNGFEKVKRDIMALGRKWKPLLKTVYQPTVRNVSKYANPADYREIFSVGIMTGSHTGQLSNIAPDGSNVTLSVGETVLKTDAEGAMLLITSGTGINQAVQIASYNTTSKIAILAAKYTTNPIIGDGYMVCTSNTDLHHYPIQVWEKFDNQGKAGVPDHYIITPNDTNGDTALLMNPDGVYGLKRRYYADLLLLDDSSALFSFILRKWQIIFEQGVYVWKLGEDDDRYQVENQLYQSLLQALMVKELEGYTPPAQAATGGQ